MADFDVERIVAQLESWGLRLTAVRLADGTLRVNRWRMMQAIEHPRRIESLWTLYIGNDQARIDLLAAHLASIPPRNRSLGSRTSPAHL
jgi:hypothetical protein